MIGPQAKATVLTVAGLTVAGSAVARAGATAHLPPVMTADPRL